MSVWNRWQIDTQQYESRQAEGRRKIQSRDRRKKIQTEEKTQKGEGKEFKPVETDINHKKEGIGTSELGGEKCQNLRNKSTSE